MKNICGTITLIGLSVNSNVCQGWYQFRNLTLQYVSRLWRYGFGPVRSRFGVLKEKAPKPWLHTNLMLM